MLINRKNENNKMTIQTHIINSLTISEILSDEIIIRTADDGLDLLGNLYYQGFDKVILYEKNIIPAFFDLKTKLAGEILQKFAQYRMPLAIVGDFSSYESRSLKDFIFESNKGKHVNFVETLEEGLK